MPAAFRGHLCDGDHEATIAMLAKVIPSGLTICQVDNAEKNKRGNDVPKPDQRRK